MELASANRLTRIGASPGTFLKDACIFFKTTDCFELSVKDREGLVNLPEILDSFNPIFTQVSLGSCMQGPIP